MIQVRFDGQSRSRLVLIWQEDAPEPAPAVDAGAANLLFSVIGQRRDTMVLAAGRAPPARAAVPFKAASPRRRKPRTAGDTPH